MTEIRIDVGHASSSRSLQEIFAAALCFPGWYGMNWDAFRDSATDPEQSNLPESLVLLNFPALTERLPRDAGILRDLLPEIARERAISIVVLDDHGAELDRWGPSLKGARDVV